MFKRKLSVTIIPIIAVVCGVFGIVGCKTDKHVHTYSEEWTRSTTEHWHEATCEHTDEKGDLGTHIDEDRNGKCDVCDYTMQTGDGHQHTFAKTWTYDGETHWHAATCGCDDEKGDEAPHVDKDGDQYCDICTGLIDHEHKFSETEWIFDLDKHWRPATCGHDNEKGGEAAHSFNNGGVCECGLKEVEKQAYNSLIDYKILDGEETDFYSWLTDLKTDGVTDIRITAQGDIVYDRSGNVEGVYVAERTVKVKAAIDGGEGLADVWFKVAMSENKTYHVDKNNIDALAVAKTNADGVAELTFKPIGGYSNGEKIKYEILLAEAKDVVALADTQDEDLKEEDIKVKPNRYSIKLPDGEEVQNGKAVVTDFQVGETDGTGTDDITGTLDFKYDVSWAASEKTVLNYSRYPQNAVEGTDITEEGLTTTLNSTGGGLFDYMLFVPSQRYSWEQGDNEAEYDAITKNFRNAASGVYKISFTVTGDRSARLYYWTGNLDLTSNQKSDGTPKDSCAESVSGIKPEGSAIADKAFTGENYVVVTIKPDLNGETGDGLNRFQLGIICDEVCQVTITVERSDYVENIGASITVGENTNNGKGYTLTEYTATRVPIGEIPAGLYTITVTPRNNFYIVGSIRAYIKENEKSFLWRGGRYTGEIRIADGDENLYIFNGNTEIICDISIANYVAPTILDTGKSYVPASGANSEEFEIKFADSVKPGIVKMQVILSTLYLKCNITIKVGSKTYTPDRQGLEKTFTFETYIDIAAGDTLKITSDCGMSKFSAEISFVDRLDIEGYPVIEEGASVKWTVERYCFIPRNTGTYRITLTTTSYEFSDYYGVNCDVGFVSVKNVITKETILKNTKDYVNPGDGTIQQTATAEFEANSGEAMILQFYWYAHVGFNILLEYVG